LTDRFYWQKIGDIFPDYKINEDGDIYSITKRSNVTPYVTTKGYHMVSIKTLLGHHAYFVHRLVAATFLPNPLRLSEINHKDGNKQNNQVDNLEWCTHAHNLRHAYATGLLVSHGPRPKLTIKDVHFIRDRKDIRSVDLAKMFDVHQNHISAIRRGLKWKNV
jgi:hypothetical protein